MVKFLLPLGLAAVFSNPVFSQTLLPATGGNDASPVFVRKVKVWTLADSVGRVHEIAPELRAAEAEILTREAELAQAEAWPNPTVDVRVDNRLQDPNGSKGANFTQLALSQPLPLRRIVRQRAVAEANLESTRENFRYQKLVLERETARVFLALQLATAKHLLAQERLRLVMESPSTSHKMGGDRLVRYLTPLERQRLAIMKETANQALDVSEREQQRALIEFRTLLVLPIEAQVELAALTSPEAPRELEVYTRMLDAHPALAAARKQSDAAQAGITAAESQRYADPSLNLFRERDYYPTGLRDVTGIGVSVQIPLWNSNQGLVAKAGAEARRAQAQFAAAQRDARSRLEQAYMQLRRLLEQAERLRVNLLEPSREVYSLTRRGFASGELNILSLLDASNTYFDARTRYLELQQESAFAAADLRLASGISALNSQERNKP
jgi:cobalt-zinc-cadmium efflux system outer membrane protein